MLFKAKLLYQQKEKEEANILLEESKMDLISMSFNTLLYMISLKLDIIS